MPSFQRHVVDLKLRAVFVMTFALLIASCANQPESHVTEERPDTIILTHKVLIGDEHFYSDYGFASVNDICHGPDGSVFVVDPLRAEVRRFTCSGELMMCYGQKGEGPGEFTEPWAIALTQSGLLLVSDARGLNAFNAESAEWLGLNDSYTRPVLLKMLGNRDSTFTALRSWAFFAEQVPVRTAQYGLYNAGNPLPVVFWSDSSRIDHSDGGFVRMCNEEPVVTVDAQGNVYISESTESKVRILKYSPEGELLASIEDDFTLAELTEEDINREQEYYTSFANRLGMTITYTPQEFWLTITSLGIDRNSLIWARVGGSDPPLFRVYDQTGELITYVRIDGVPVNGRYLDIRISPWGMAGFTFDPSAELVQVLLYEVPEISTASSN